METSTNIVTAVEASTIEVAAKNKKKELKFPIWPEEVIRMPCKEFHLYIKRNRLTEEQQADLRQVRRREQGKRAAREHRKRRAEAGTEHVEAGVDEAGVVDNAIKRACVAANAVADKSEDKDVNRILLIINFLQKEADRLQTEQDALGGILKLSENSHCDL